MKKICHLFSFVLLLFGVSSASAVMVKLTDFPLANGEPARPYSVPLLYNDALWFTTQGGGNTGFGSLARWNLNTSTLQTVFGNMENTNGNTPQGGLARDGDVLYLTTTRGGTGDRGVLASYHTTTNTYTVLWNSPSNSPNTNPNTLIGNPEVIDRGTHKEVYFLTRNGGVSSTGGTVHKYNTVTNTTTLVANLPGVPGGQQPLEGGFTRVGDTLYFTTFTGGTTGGGFPNGAGTLMALDLATDTLTTLATLPPGDGSTRFPANNPAYDSGTNSLYFTTAGLSLEPGAIMRFDLNTNTLSTLYELQGAPTTAGPFPDGRFAYSQVAIFQGDLYFTTIQGGLYGGGTLNRFSLVDNSFTVLWNLGNDTNLGIHWGSESRGGPIYAHIDGQDFLFLMTRTGGQFNQGTLLRYQIIPEPSAFLLLGLGAGLFALRRRMASKT
jgi:uncharacterized repeat protein (TIGR03803 family)